MSSNQYHYPSQPDRMETRAQCTLPPISFLLEENAQANTNDSRGPTHQYTHGAPVFQHTHGAPVFQHTHGAPVFQHTHGAPVFQHTRGPPVFQHTRGPPVFQHTYDHPVYQHSHEHAMSQHSDEAFYGSPKAESSSRDDRRSQSQSHKGGPKKMLKKMAKKMAKKIPKIRRERESRGQLGRGFNLMEDSLQNYFHWPDQQMSKQTSGNANTSGLMYSKRSILEASLASWLSYIDKGYKEAVDGGYLQEWQQERRQEIEDVRLGKTHLLLDFDVECRPDKAGLSTAKSKYKCAEHKEKNMPWDDCRRQEGRRGFTGRRGAFCNSRGVPPILDDEEYEALLSG